MIGLSSLLSRELGNKGSGVGKERKGNGEGGLGEEGVRKEVEETGGEA